MPNNSLQLSLDNPIRVIGRGLTQQNVALVSNKRQSIDDGNGTL
jgi:hypothetical protein